MQIDGLSAELTALGVDWRILALLGVATLLVVIGAVSMWRQRRRASRSRLRSRGLETDMTVEAVEDTPEAIFAAPSLPVMVCEAELIERRPLSEAQWDSPVPAAWTIFRLRVDESAQMQVGLLLPVQHKEAYSAGFLERLDGEGAETLLEHFSRALGGPVPGRAITGSTAGFLEFKTFVRNERPEVIPGTLDLSEAAYWVYVKLFVQNTLELYLRVNAAEHKAEITAVRSTRGDELMRVLAATLRPEVAAANG